MAHQHAKAGMDTGGGDLARAEGAPRPGYCPVCGRPANATGAVVARFGEAFCSDTHADQFTEAVRTARVQTAAARTDREVAAGGVARGASSGWKASLGRALCWGTPALALVGVALVLFGGGGLLAGGAAAALPLLAALACPAAMYLMMRSMSKTGHENGREVDRNPSRPAAKE
jgi:hypothetical protein